MLVATRTYSSDEFDNAGYDFMIVKIDLDEARILSRYATLFDIAKKGNPTLLEMTFQVTDVEAEFYSSGEEETEVEQHLEDDSWDVLPDDLELPFTPRDAQAPHDVYLVVNEHGFTWQANPGEGSLEINSETIPRDILARVL